MVTLLLWLNPLGRCSVDLTISSFLSGDRIPSMLTCPPGSMTGVRFILLSFNPPLLYRNINPTRRRSDQSLVNRLAHMSVRQFHAERHRLAENMNLDTCLLNIFLASCNPLRFCLLYVWIWSTAQGIGVFYIVAVPFGYLFFSQSR